MRRLYRVLSYSPSAAPNESGGVLFIPPQGAGRIDNPAEYDVLYVGDSPAGVCAEVFNRGKYRTVWTEDMFVGSDPAVRRVLAWYDVPDRTHICNLDDPGELLARSLRPSTIVTRDYARSRGWALNLFAEKKWAGVSWWSYHDARWASMGLWNTDAIAEYDLETLTLDHPAIAEAANVLSIRLRPS